MSSIAKLRIDAQPHAAGLTHRPDTLATTRTVTVNHRQLTDAYMDVRHVSGRLHNVEDLSELGWSDLNDLCRSIHHAAESTGAMLVETAKGGMR